MFDREIKVESPLGEKHPNVGLITQAVVSSLGGCMAHDVVKGCAGGSIRAGKHYWRRPTIALMSNPVERSRFKLHEIPAPYVNYFVNDITKAHQSEIAASSGGSIVIDITRDLFTGVLDLGGGSYIMNPAEGVGIVDGLTKETMNQEVLKSILGFEPRFISYQQSDGEFFELWKFFFVRKLEFLKRHFDRVILLEIYFTARLITGGLKPDLVDASERANVMLTDMYAFAREQDLKIVGLERSAFRTGHMVPWGGPSLTHFVPETIARLSDRVRAVVATSGERPRYLVRQAYRRAQNHEEAMLWLSSEKAERAKLEARLNAAEEERAHLQSRADGDVQQLKGRCEELEALLAQRDADCAELAARLQVGDERVALMEAQSAAEARRQLLARASAPASGYARARKSLARARRRCARALGL